MDLVARARLRDEPAVFLIHLEHEAQQKPFEARMFRYFTALRERHGCRIYPIALLSFESRRPRAGLYREAFPDLEVLRFRFRVIQLSRLDWRDYLRSDNPVAAALMTRMRIQPSDRPIVKAASLRTAMRLRLTPQALQLLGEFLGRYLPLNQEEDAVFQRELQGMDEEERAKLMQTSNEWILKGLAQGREEATRRALCTILNSRFGDVPADVLNRLESIHDAAHLERLVEEALACSSLAAFEPAIAET